MIDDSVSIVALVNCSGEDIDHIVDLFIGGGLHCLSITNLIRDISNSLDVESPEDEDVLTAIRTGGYSIASSFWMNQVLNMIPDGKSKILVADACPKDLINDVTIPVFVYRSDNMPDNKGNDFFIQLTDNTSELQNKIASIITNL